jgi:ankyrin repeat protein
MWAARNGHLDAVETLFAAGADVNAVSMKKITAWRWATKFNHQNIIEHLRQAGAEESKPSLMERWRDRLTVPLIRWLNRPMYRE